MRSWVSEIHLSPGFLLSLPSAGNRDRDLYLWPCWHSHSLTPATFVTPGWAWTRSSEAACSLFSLCIAVLRNPSPAGTILPLQILAAVSLHQLLHRRLETGLFFFCSLLLSLSPSHPQKAAPKAPGGFSTKAVKCCWFRLWQISGNFTEWRDGKMTSHFARGDCQWGRQDECHGAFPGTNSFLGDFYPRLATCFSQFGVKARNSLLFVILWPKCSLHEQDSCSGACISWAVLFCWWGYPGARETLIFWVLLGQVQKWELLN